MSETVDGAVLWILFVPTFAEHLTFFFFLQAPTCILHAAKLE